METQSSWCLSHQNVYSYKWITLANYKAPVYSFGMILLSGLKHVEVTQLNQSHLPEGSMQAAPGVIFLPILLWRRWRFPLKTKKAYRFILNMDFYEERSRLKKKKASNTLHDQVEELQWNKTRKLDEQLLIVFSCEVYAKIASAR